MTTATLPQDLAETLDRLATALGAMGDGRPRPLCRAVGRLPRRDAVRRLGPDGPRPRHRHHDVPVGGEPFSGGPIVPNNDVVA